MCICPESFRGVRKKRSDEPTGPRGTEDQRLKSRRESGETVNQIRNLNRTDQVFPLNLPSTNETECDSYGYDTKAI